METNMTDDLWEDWEFPTHCSNCGRELVEVQEKDGFDPRTGEPIIATWLQCPLFPRNGFLSLFRGIHTSSSKDHPLIGRAYR